MKFRLWLDHIETPPHMPHLFWRDSLEEAERLESRFLPLEDVRRMERELEDEEYVDMRLSREFPYKMDRIFRGDGHKEKLSERIRDMMDSGDLAKSRPDLYWGEYGLVSRLDLFGDSAESALNYTREYSEFFRKRKKYINYGEIEKADISPEGREKVLRLKDVYDAVFDYIRLARRVGRAARSFIASRNHRAKAFYAGEDETKTIPGAGGLNVLYHATPYVREIVREGFKTKEEVGRESLGGNTDGGISFTADLRVAREIAKCFVEMIHIAKGKMTVNDVLKMINSERKRGDMPWALKDYVNKARQRQWQWGNPRTRELSKRTGIPMPGKPYEINDRKEAFDLYRRYLAWSDRRYDPLFFGVDPSNFESMDEANVGVVAARVDMSKVMSYHHSMEEYRVPVGAIMKVGVPGRFGSPRGS
jgi:hypothetical protein